MQQTNYMGVAESDIRVNIKSGTTNLNDLIVPNTCPFMRNFVLNLTPIQHLNCWTQSLMDLSGNFLLPQQLNFTGLSHFESCE